MLSSYWHEGNGLEAAGRRGEEEGEEERESERKGKKKVIPGGQSQLD